MLISVLVRSVSAGIGFGRVGDDSRAVRQAFLPVVDSCVYLGLPLSEALWHLYGGTDDSAMAIHPGSYSAAG